MIDIRGQPLLRRLVATLGEGGVRDVTVVRGYRKEAIDLPSVVTVDNEAYDETGEVASLACALDRFTGHAIVVYGDVLFRRYILDGLLELDADIALAVDALAAPRTRAPARQRDLVAATRSFSGYYLDEEPALVTRVDDALPQADIAGEWIGLARFSPRGAEWARAEIAAMREEGRLETADMPELLTRLAARHPVVVHYVTGHWLDVDDLADLAEARNFP
jgi:phosphoenolpyruvate phosphomutase